MFYGIKRIFRNLKFWLPVITKDENFDFYYFEEILLHKLRSMRDYFNSDMSVCVGSKEIAQEINEVIELLEKVRADKYEEEIDPAFYNWINAFIKGQKFFDLQGNFTSIKFSDAEREKRMEIYLQAEKNKKNDIAKAYRLIAENSEKWWD